MNLWKGCVTMATRLYGPPSLTSVSSTYRSRSDLNVVPYPPANQFLGFRMAPADSLQRNGLAFARRCLWGQTPAEEVSSCGFNLSEPPDCLLASGGRATSSVQKREGWAQSLSHPSLTRSEAPAPRPGLARLVRG